MNNADAYHEAMSAHRHYDNLSQVAVTSLVAIIGATPVAFEKVATMRFGGLVFAAGAVLMWLIYQIYGRFDTHATVALKVAELFEAKSVEGSRGVQVGSTTVYGFADAFSRKRELDGFSKITAGGFIYKTVGRIAIAIGAVYLLTAATLIATKFGWLHIAF